MQKKQLISRLKEVAAKIDHLSVNVVSDPGIQAALENYIQCVELGKDENECRPALEVLRRQLRHVFTLKDNFPEKLLDECFELELMLTRYWPENVRNEDKTKLREPILFDDIDDVDDEKNVIALPSSRQLYAKESLIKHFKNHIAYHNHEAEKPSDEFRNCLNEWDVRHLSRNGIVFVTQEEIDRQRRRAVIESAGEMIEDQNLFGQDVILAIIQATNDRARWRLIGLIVGILSGCVVVLAGFVLLVPEMWIATIIVIALTAVLTGGLFMLKRPQPEDVYVSRFSQFVRGVICILGAEFMAITLLSALATGVMTVLTASALVSSATFASFAATLHLCQPIIAGIVFGMGLMAEVLRQDGMKKMCHYIFYTPIEMTVRIFSKIGAGIGQLMDLCVAERGVADVPADVELPPIQPVVGENNYRDIMNQLEINRPPPYAMQDAAHLAIPEPAMQGWENDPLSVRRPNAEALESLWAVHNPAGPRY